MTTMPAAVHELLNSALTGELTVVGSRGQPITHPLLPLWDGDKIYMTSSVLFSKKLEHIKRNGRVSLAISDPIATGGLAARCTIQGDARIIEDDPHDTWEQVLPLWRAKEPVSQISWPNGSRCRCSSSDHSSRSRRGACCGGRMAILRGDREPPRSG
jgi:nitroimidazol reductase NimA-like FMN-containing flavoprotein (pyridoxamine 5'-phosphate oxidase superfamily)